MTKKATVVAMASRDKAPAQLERVATELDLQKLPGYLIRRLDSRAASLYEQFTGQTDLTPRQFGVLLTLS